MPALSIAINGVTLATVSMDGCDVMSLHAAGTRIDENLGALDLSGGSYPESGESTYLTWINQIPLQTGQVIMVTFLDAAPTSHAGKTFDELFPDEASSTRTELKPRGDLFAEVRSMQTLRDRFSFRIDSSSGINFAGETTQDEYGFGFHVLWNSRSPDKARVALHSYTLDQLEARGPMNYHFEDELHYGDWVRFELTA